MTRVLIALAIPPVLFACPAHADDAGFLADLQQQGITNTNGAQMSVMAGHYICGQLQQGANPEAIAAAIHYNSDNQQGDNGLSLYQAREEVLDAITDICPTYLKQFNPRDFN